MVNHEKLYVTVSRLDKNPIPDLAYYVNTNSNMLSLLLVISVWFKQSINLYFNLYAKISHTLIIELLQEVFEMFFLQMYNLQGWK